MNPVHLAWLLPITVALSVRATLDVVAIVRRRRAERTLEQLRRNAITTSMRLLRDARGVTHYPIVAHHFNEWERELANQGEQP